MSDLTIYEYKDNLYVIIQDESLFKDPVTRKWIPIVIYTPVGLTHQPLFVREKSEFYERFKPKQ